MKAPKRNAVQQAGFLLGMYGQFLKIYLKTLVEYRADTLIAIVAGIIAQGSTLAFLTVIFSRIPALAGWDFYELVFLFGLAAAGRALNQTFLNAPFLITGYIRYGKLDMMMVRPVGVLFQSIGYGQELNGVGQLCTGLVIMVYSALKLDMTWSYGQVGFAILALLCSALIQFAILLTISVLTFWVHEVRSLIFPVTWLYDFARYPLQIFHPVLRGLLTYVFPYAIGSFYPAAYLLHHERYEWALWGVPLVTLAVLGVALWIWSLGLRRYAGVAG
ncbi:ABC transporter permease [Paenibacillus whitsoniae]|uniref:ABC transporter permease n=1 Tax=Paenibacillus whitsoniae TaxID=2496558 RepID=A0A3S0BPZ6_9BACL|nr:ABC-2 family transporter protein [Paenibacillus whitsoniae]RTE00245.1 hypothetical protein EJQ19_31450 [Paenibacillus whitsoniae]